MTDIGSLGRDAAGYVDVVSKGRVHYEREILAVAFGTGIITAALTSGMYLDPMFHITGLLCFFVHRGYNNSSREKLLRLMESEKFHDYHIDEQARKKSWELPDPKILTERNMRNDIISAVLFTLLPPIGYARLATTWFNLRRNSFNFKRVEKSMILGDRIKQKIESEPKNQKEVKTWFREFCVGGICIGPRKTDDALSV